MRILLDVTAEKIISLLAKLHPILFTVLREIGPACRYSGDKTHHNDKANEYVVLRITTFSTVLDILLLLLNAMRYSAVKLNIQRLRGKFLEAGDCSSHQEMHVVYFWSFTVR